MHAVSQQILDYILSSPHSPSVREISLVVDRAPSTVHKHLDDLEREGKIVRMGAARRIAPVERQATV